MAKYYQSSLQQPISMDIVHARYDQNGHTHSPQLPKREKHIAVLSKGWHTSYR